LNKAVTAHGGIDKFKAVKSTQVKGTFTISTGQGEIPLGFETLEILPDKSRSVVNMMGQEIIDATNGDSGWKTSPQTGGVEDKTAEELADEKKSMVRNTIIIFQQSDLPSYQAVYDGEGTMGETKVEYVTLVDAAGDQICRLAICSESGKLMAKSYWGKTMMGEGQIEEILSEFTEIDGVLLPLKSVRTLDGQKFAVQVKTEMNLNVEVPPNSFTKPE